MHVCIRYIMKHMRRNIYRHVPSARCSALLAAAAVLLSGGLLRAQVTSGSPPVPLPSAEAVTNRNTDSFFGSIPQGKATNETIELTIEDALDRGLKYNLGLYLSDQTTDQTRAARLKTLSDKLPHIAGSLTEEEEKVNLKALGF